MEITFLYPHTKTSLEACRDETAERVEKLASLYGSENSESASAQRLLERLVRDGELTTESSSFSDSAYGALCLDKATSLGFCQAYLLLLRKMSIPCHLVHGTYGVEKMVWCQLQLDGERYYTDKELAVILKVSRRSLQDYRNNGILPYTQIGGRILYRASDIERTLMDGYKEAYRQNRKT